MTGKKLGLDPQTMIDVMNVGTGVNFSTKYSQKSLKSYDTGYQLELLVKDIGDTAFSTFHVSIILRDDSQGFICNLVNALELLGDLAVSSLVGFVDRRAVTTGVTLAAHEHLLMESMTWL